MSKELSEVLLGFRRSLQLVSRPEKFHLLIASLIMIVNGALTNLPAVILGRFIDTTLVTDQLNFTAALPLITIIIVILLVREILTVIRKYLVENVSTQTEKQQTLAVIERLLKTDVTFLQSQQVGSLQGKVFRSVQGLVRVIKLSFLEFLPILFTGIVALIIAFIQSPQVGLLMAFVIPTSFFIVLKQIASQKGIRVSLLRGKEQIDGALVEMLGGIETVRVLNTADQEVGKVETVAERLRVKEMKHHLQMALYDAAKYLNEGFFYIAVISVSIYLASQGVISSGDILVYSVLFLSVTGPLREIHRILDQAHEGSILVNDLYGLLTQPIDASFSPTTDNAADNESVVLNVRQLSFSYTNGKESLKNVSFTLKKGEKLGIAGASGSGKSTLTKILLRLVHGFSGEVYLFSKELSSISREELAERIAYVPQKPFVFSGTIRDNISYGCRGPVDDEAVIAAATKANIYTEVVDALGGLTGKVTENGNNLSGGQRQRLAIARLILQSPDLFIFDEATSALDTVNEAIIQENIERFFPDTTMITIAHRLTTLRNTNRILVFDKGSVVQEGSFKELSRQKGLFAEYLRQKDTNF